MTPHLELLDRIMPSLWRATWQATMLIALVFVVRAVLGKRLAPAWRFALWGVVLARLLAPALPDSPLSLFRLTAAVAAHREDASPDPNVLTSPGISPPVIQEPSPRLADPLPLSGASARPTEPAAYPAPERAPAPADSPTTAWTPPRLLGLAWLGGVLFLSARMAFVAARLRRRSREWLDADDPHLTALFDRCRSMMGAGLRPVRLRVTGDDLGPAATGLWRPCILIPRSVLISTTPSDLEHVLFHELAHVRRWDVAVHWLMTIACIVHWFNPAVWFAAARMRSDRELACDAAVLRRLGRARRAAYGDTVLKLAARLVPPRPLPGLVGVFGTQRQLHERIAMIARYTPPGRGWGLISAGLLCALAVAGLTDAAAPGPADEPPVTTKVVPKSPEKAEHDARAREAIITLSGTVRDADRRPLEGVSVRLFRVRESHLDAGSIEQVDKMETPEGGRFRFADLPAPFWEGQARESLTYALAVTRPGLSSAILPIFPDQRTEGLDVTLKPAGTLRGRVTDRRGEPVPGAEVYLHGIGSGERLVPGLLNTTTDEQGRYEIPDLAIWDAKESSAFDPETGVGTVVTECYFRVRHPDYGLKLAGYKAIPSVVDVRLEPAGVIEGRVLDAVTGEPAADATVMAQGTEKQGFHRVRIDHDGRYRLTSLVADRYNVWASLPDRTVVALDSLPIAAGETKRAPDLTLIGGGFIAGRVIDAATGRPVGRLADGWRIQIGLHGPSRPTSGAAVESTTVADDGTYRLRVAPGENFPYIQRSNVADRDADTALRDPIVVREGETVALDIRLGPRRDTGGIGIVRSEHGDRSAVQRPSDDRREARPNAEGKGDQPLAAQFAALKQRFEARERRFHEALVAANKLEPKARSGKVTDENETFQRDWDAMADEVRKLIRAHPADPAAFEGIILLPGLMRSFLDDDLVRIVRDHFMNDPRMGQLCDALAYRSEGWSGDLLKDVAARHPDRKVRGQATYALGLWWRLGPDTMTLGRDHDESATRQCLAEAKRSFTQVCEDYADVTSTDGTSRLADKARAELARIANLPNLKVGKVAPEITGEDLDGKPLKLSDHRGKVVVVCFWATWCGPCMAMVPHERALVKRMEGKPFALLGVNSDEADDREKAKQATREKQMTWPSWWDGGFRGAIQTAYDVAHWPTVYVLDPEGVIRYVDVRGEGLDRAVDTLLAEMGARTKEAPAR